MTPARRSPKRVAIVSFHSHGDRSFLDDRDLAILSGDLRLDRFDNDLVLVAFGAGDVEDRETEAALIERLRVYDAVVYERVWSAELVARIRAALPDRTFVHLRGEHVLDDPPADYVCAEIPRRTLPRLLAYLRGDAPSLPTGVLRRADGEWLADGTPSLAEASPPRFAPNLHPILLNPEAFPAERTFSVQGNRGCPYQADARDNPVYAGVAIPSGLGRGCAFCTTGNEYAAQPASETAASVLEQIRYVRQDALELDHIVLKDQNPFVYLTEVVETLAAEGLGPFTLLLETRADWFLRSQRRFDRALQAARTGGIRISPFLVGIENFSQPELDRYNKGTTGEANIEFIERLWELKARYGDTLDLESASFGFVLLSPWTTMADLTANLAAIRRTRFDQLRGRILLSRARLYPDTALYYLAERDGLLTEAHRDGQDSSLRYGYYPAHPWRFLHDDVSHFAALAAELVARTGGRDEVALFAALLDAFQAAPDHQTVTGESILERLQDASPRPPTAISSAPTDLEVRFERLVAPLPLRGTFAGGWSVVELDAGPGLLRVELGRDGHDPVRVEIVPRGSGPSFARSRHYDMRFQSRELTPEQHRAVDALCSAIAANDR